MSNFVFLSKTDSFGNCPEWWQNFVMEINPDGKANIVQNYLKNIGAAMEGDGVEFEEKDSMVSFLLMWAS